MALGAKTLDPAGILLAVGGVPVLSAQQMEDVVDSVTALEAADAVTAGDNIVVTDGEVSLDPVLTGITSITATADLALVAAGGDGDINITATGTGTVNVTGTIACGTILGGAASFSGAVTAQSALTLEGAEYLQRIISPAALADADNPDFAPANGDIARIVRLTSGGASTTLSGFAGGANGRVVTFINIAANVIEILAASGLSAAANRFAGAATLAASGAAGSSATFWYDSTSTVWRQI